MPAEILSFHDVRFDLPQQTLFQHVSFSIRPGEHVALVGANGVGKTTLFQLILKQLQPTDGNIFRGYTNVGHVAQHLTSSTPAIRLVEQADRVRYEAREAILHSSSLEVYQAAFDLDAFSLETDAARALKEVQLPEHVWSHPFDTLSGGEQTRIQLACLLVQQPDFILLDEPTNHLDADTLDWLIHWMHQTPLTILYVSHERAFIDATAEAVIELTPSQTTRYKGNYQAYRQQKEQERLTQEHEYEKQEKTRKELKRMINQYQNWHQQAVAHASERDPYAKKKAAKQAKKFKAKEKQLEQTLNHRVAKPESPSSVHVAFEAAPFSAKQLLELDAVSFSYEERTLFQKLSFSMQQGDRIAVIGRNGSGKTTLLRVIQGELNPTEGTVTCHPALTVGYFSQALSDLPVSGSLLDALLQETTISETDARTLLACFLFRRDQVYKPIAEASMGERCRIAFLRLYFSGARLLILDEPTNYLDLTTREQIESALDVFPGELLFVSHDRYFNDRLSNRTISLDPHEHATVHPVGTKQLREQQPSDINAIQNDLKRLDDLTGTIDFDRS
ncbi:ribosomal protection-like ABC-F family protein [Exiguobacterium sp. RIT594]|uniref:ribosomal protection-like ABC-F family protein n=1 Tax=Exiguobacterium sp. RIT594 TaxID=2282449 RepID=UPI000DF72F4D|nr:ABC-F type ribosomal protection protein [Exiguobacterium sp. RIT594]RDB32667.1 ABC transporter ATP-binding protein [Exiguobacterium sp. RIT594]